MKARVPGMKTKPQIGIAIAIEVAAPTAEAAGTAQRPGRRFIRAQAQRTQVDVAHIEIG